MIGKNEFKIFVAATIIYMMCVCFAFPVFLVMFGVLHWGFAVPLILACLVVIASMLSK
jgi:hypothetical protein